MTEQNQQDASAQDEAKEKMRQALERKADREHQHQQAPPNTGAVHGSEISSPGRRQFRRKSG